MASHLTVTTAANPGVAVKGLNAAANANGAETGKDIFAELLGSDEKVAEKPSATPATAAPAAGSLLDLALDPNTDEKPDDTPDPVAVPIEAAAPIQQPISPQTVLSGIIEGLNALRAAAQNGQAPSPDDLAKLDAGLDTLAGMLGLSLDDLPSMDELAAMAAQPLPAGDTVEAQLISTLAPLTKTVLTEAANATTTDPALSDQLKAIGDKLAALLKGLNDGTVDLDAMADLDGNKAAITPDLDAALKRLLQPLALAPKAAATVFTAPKLETAEPTLSGKATDAAAPTDPEASASDTAKPLLKADATPDATTDIADKSDKARDKDKAAPTPTPATATVKSVDTTPDAQSTGQIGNQATARVEVAAARPVIAGYQTSQQHLNLPQIAFELVRQVHDGNSRFQMRLDPPELGKIEVRIDIDRSGQVNARLTVEKAETLDLMQRDQRGLEKALQQAGLDSAKTNLEFSLKQNSSGQQQGQDNSSRQPFYGADTPREAEEAPAPTVNLYRASLSASGVNIIA